MNNIINIENPFEQIEKELQQHTKSSTVPSNIIEVAENKTVDGETSQAIDRLSGAIGQGLLEVKRKTHKYRNIKVALPSQGKFYPQNSALYGKEFINIRNLISPDQDILRNPKLNKAGLAVDKLLQAVVLDNINTDELLSGDREALLLALRVDAFDSLYEPGIKYECEVCEESFIPKFDLGQLEPRTPTKELLEQSGNIFEIMLPSGVKVGLKFLTNKEEIQITEFAKNADNILANSKTTIRRWFHVVSFDDITDRANIRDEMFALDIKDARAIDKFLQDNEPGIFMRQEVECPDCSSRQIVAIPITQAFFFPKL